VGDLDKEFENFRFMYNR